MIYRAIGNIKKLYNKSYIWHYAFLDYIDTDNHIQKYFENLRKKCPRKLRVLDIGCGPTQYNRLRLEELNYEYFGIDINGDYPIIKWNGFEIPFQNEFFDCVLISWTLQNISNPKFLISEISRTLKKDGCGLIITTILSPIATEGNLHSLSSPLEKQRLFPEGLRLLLKNEFESIQISGLGGPGQIFSQYLSFIWWNTYKNPKLYIKFFSFILFPLFILKSIVFNIIGLLINKLDKTGKFFPSICVTFVKTKSSNI